MMHGYKIPGNDWHIPDAPPTTPEQQHAAMLTLAAHARDADELRCWLHMLGLERTP